MGDAGGYKLNSMPLCFINARFHGVQKNVNVINDNTAKAL